jgi:hypothetical protein
LSAASLELRQPRIRESARNKIRSLVTIHVPPRHAHHLIRTGEAQLQFVQGTGRMYDADQSAVRKYFYQPSWLKHIPRPRTVGNRAIETDENAVLDQRPWLCSSENVSRSELEASNLIGGKACSHKHDVSIVSHAA